jgi:hypothetical protein
LASSPSQVEEKKQNTKKKKTIEKKKYAKKGGSLPLSSRFALSFLALTLPFHFLLPLLPSRFSTPISNAFS